MLIQSFTKDILNYAEWTLRVKREKVNRQLCRTLENMRKDGVIDSKRWCEWDGILYGIAQYIRTGRASVEIENKVDSLTGYGFIKLIIKIWLDGATCPGDAWDWLREKGHNLDKLIK